MRKITICLLVLLLTNSLPAQKKVILEKFRCYNMNNPVLSYLGNSDIRKTVATYLHQSLLQQQMYLADTSGFEVELLDFNFVEPVIKPEYTDNDTGNLHIYVDLIELDPYYFFRSGEYQSEDSSLIKRVKTVFLLTTRFFTADKKPLNRETLAIAIGEATTPGIGNPYNNGIRFTDLTVTPKTFTDLFKTASAMLLRPNNDLSLIELRLQPAYYADNYLLPKTSHKPRIFVTDNNNISTYRWGNQAEMIRNGEALYVEIRIKSKKAEKYPDDLTAAIKGTERFSASDYVFLRQEGRDVARDRNYLIQLVTQVDPDNIPHDRRYLFTNFLAGDFHYLFLEKDTLAKFSILKQVKEKNNKLYPNLLSNGYDSSNLYSLPAPISSVTEWSVVYNYILNGSLGGTPFQVKCSGTENTVREIFLAGKLVCIAQGKYRPEKFVVFDASLSAEKLNQLFLISFNRFLE